MTDSNSAPRRNAGEHSIGRFHQESKGCPRVGPDGARPEHDCQARFRARAWVETATGAKVRKTLYGDSHREVVKKLKALTVAEAKREVLDSGRSITVAEWIRFPEPGEEGLENYWTEHQHEWKVNTRKGYRTLVKRIVPLIGHQRLDRLTPDHVAGMLTKLRAAGLAEPTLLRTYRFLSKALKVAVRRGKAARNVCSSDYVDAPSGKCRKIAALTVAEAWKVLDAAGEDPRWFVALLAGLRQGEALGLRWYDVHECEDIPFPHLITREAVSRETGVGLVFDRPKSEESTDRRVPLIPEVASRLAAARAAHYAAGGSDTDLVFRSTTGKPRSAQNDWAEWTALLKVAGVSHKRPHAARHTTGQLLESAGVPDRVVAEILGHSTVQVTHGYQEGNEVALRDALRSFTTHWEGTRAERVA